MISIDEHPPPDPSSSNYQNHHHHHQQQQLSHEAFASVSDIDLLKPNTDANLDDTNYQLPNFSIRDYVFGSRCKDIACNWPFSSESLQLCMSYGVKNLLPPFQSLDSLRGSSSLSKCVVDNRLPAEETVGRFDGKLIDDQCHHDENLAHTMSNKSTLASSQKTVKKCKFIMKLNSGVTPVEEVTPNNFIVPEITMAAKVCPVCKTFSSSSNTTLNAHIDRCLSEESSIKWTANPKVTVKHKVKPRKMRLLVDIYKTAPHCTIEELDKRNGTSWATNSSFPDQELEFQVEEEEKKEEPQEPTFVPEIADREDHEGAVYVDTNGTKVRILSMPKVGNLHNHVVRKLQKGGKGSKLVIKKKKKKAYGKKNHPKLLKLSPNSKELSKKVITNGQEENVVVNESCNKEDQGENPMKAKVHKHMDDLAITRPLWACSKRTGLSKKKLPALTKPNEGTDLGDTCEDLPSIKSKGSKLSSLKKKLKSASREHNAGSKFNLERKFSALTESPDHCLSKNDDVTGPSQDCLSKSRMEEDTDEKLSFEIENDMGFTSSNGDHSSGGLEVTSESARTDDQVPFQSDHIRIVGNFMDLRNSDDEFSKLVSQMDNTFDSQDGIDDHIEKEGSYFEEVDPIPIPGPPGSFLPLSPGADMVSEELQGNSSLTTMSRVQSSEDQQHHDVVKMDFISDSPISTVSSPSFARSASVRFQDTRLDYTRVMVDAVDKRSVNASDSRSVDEIFAEKGQNPSDYQNDQPCCCLRKEGMFSNVNIPSYDQESKERVLDPNRRPNSINFRSDLVSLTLSPPETVKSPADALKLPVYRDCESAVSPTTPVLRLMGKNLTVVNTDDEQFGPRPGSTPMHHQQLNNIISENHNSFFSGYHSQHHINFSHNQNSSMPQFSNLHLPNNSRSLTDSRPIHALDTMFPSTTNGLMAPANCHRLDSTRNAAKEIIGIDDSSETEADDHMFKERMRRSHASSSFIPLLEKSYSFANTYNNGGVFPVFREVVNDGNRGRWVNTETGSPLSSITRMSSSTAYYPRSFSLPRTQREGGL